MLKERVDRWFSKFKKYLFSYKDGFFEIPYLVNSPQVLIELFIKVPFGTHSEKEQTIRTRNPLNEGILHYQEIEDGLFVMVSEIRFKKNANFIFTYDKYLPHDYFYLTYYIDQQSVPSTNPLIDGLKFTSKSWWLFKPGAPTSASHLKNTSGLYISACFRIDWLRNFLARAEHADFRELNYFLNSDLGYIIWPDIENNETYPHGEICRTMYSKGEKGVADIPLLKKQTEELIAFFAHKMQRDNITEQHFEIDNAERTRIIRAEKMLVDNLFKKFPGIEQIALTVGLSETKLKTCFKLVYGESLYQYFQSAQMKSAREILVLRKMKIGEVALLFGYENASKFSAAFKKHFGVLPSEVESVS